MTSQITDDHIRAAGAILGKASLLDSRMPKPDEGSVAAWAEILAEQGAGLTVDDLLPAVTQHYATSTERLMPADLLKLARARRRDVIERSDLDSQVRRRLELVADAKAADGGPEPLPAGETLDRKQAVQRAIESLGGKLGNLDRPAPAIGKGKLEVEQPTPVPCPDCGSVAKCEHDELERPEYREGGQL